MSTVTVTPEGEQNLAKPQTEQAVFGPYSNTDPPEYGKKVLSARLRRSLPSAAMYTTRGAT